MADPVAYGLIGDPSLTRAAMIPVARRTFTDPGDDITEELGGLELATPGLLYDPLMGMASTGAMLMGRMPVDPDVVTQTLLDTSVGSGLLGAATGAAPRGAVLVRMYCQVGFYDVRPARENIRTVIDANTIGGDVVGDETVPIGLLSGGASSSARAQKAIDDIADSMSGPEGFIERLIVDQDNNVIEGAHRLEALRKLGVDEVPVTRIVDPQASFTPDTKVAMRAAIQKAKKTNSDYENQIISQLGEMLADPDVAGDPKKVFEVYDPAKGFEDQFKAALKVIELGANKAPTAALPGLLDDVGIETTQRGNVLEITKIETPDNLRGQGLADQRLEQLIQQADADGTTLALTPSNAFGANKSRLTKWYKRHGFVPNKGRNKDFTTRESMVRPPRNIELGANKAPTAALPGLLDDTASRISSSFSRDEDAIGVVPNQMDDYANVTTTMTPSRYLNLAKPIGKLTESDKETIKYFENVFREQSDKTVANPWLDITWDKSAGKWDVTGHEGRHRMIAAKNVFGPDAEIPVQLFPKQEGAGKIPIKALNDPRQMAFYGLDQNTAAQMKTALGQRFGMEGLPFILGANKAPTAALPGLLDDVGKGSGAAHARPLNPTNRSLKGINDSPDDNQPPKENFSAVENIYNLYFYNQNIPPKTAEKIKAVIQKHTATNDINTAERAMLGPALDEIKSLQSAAKSKAKKPRWPSKIDLTTIDGVASALKQKLGGGVISGKPYNSRYFDVGENSRLRISDHLAATRRSANNSGEVIVSYGSKGINFDVGGDSLTIPYNDKRLSNRDGLQELIDLIQGSDSIELGANKSSTAALPSLLQDRSGNIDQRSLLSRTPRKRDEFPIFGLLGQRLYTATAPDGSI